MNSIALRSLLLALAFVAMACSLSCTSISRNVRASPFPEDLEYMPKERVRTAMWVLAAEVQALERLIEDPAEMERSTRRASIEATLDRMRTAARTLDEPGRSSQHPVLNENLGAFLERLDRAKRAVRQDPPNYFYAGTVAGSCYLCHGRAYTMAPTNQGG